MLLQAKSACHTLTSWKLIPCAAAWYIEAAEAGRTDGQGAEANMTCQDLAQTALQYMALALANRAHAVAKMDSLVKERKANQLDQCTAMLQLQQELDAGLHLPSDFMSKP